MMKTFTVKAAAFVFTAVLIATFLGWQAWLGFLIGTLLADIFGMAKAIPQID
jgi:hypothetical protein